MKVQIVPLMLTSARVTAPLRDAIFDAADRHGVPVNEFLIKAAAERLIADGAKLPGIFQFGDIGGSR